MSYYNISQYHQDSIYLLGSRQDFEFSTMLSYDNSTQLYPMCDILIEVTGDTTSRPDKKILLHKMPFIGSFDLNNYRNVLTYNQFQASFVDCNAINEKFPVDTRFKLYEGNESQYYVFSKIFLPPSNIVFFLSYDSGLEFNAYLIPYTIGI